MRYGSVCSGIEAATVAWDSLGWTPQWFSEIEPFPSAVLAHHYPNVPNFGDMTKFKEWKLDDTTAIDVLVGGTPCQSFSVAGLRKGLEDPRGNLMLTYLAIANKYRPKWLVWENVPGVLSSNGGNDFASLLRGMGELGYGFAYRVLDAQYFGVAQRRRRVFVVGCLGNWRAAAAVLFERHSLSGHPAPSRKARKEVAGAIGARTCRSSGVQDAECGHMIPVYGGSDPECADTVTSKWSKGSGGPSGNECGLFVAQPIMEVENTASHQSQGLAWPPEIAPTLNASFGNKQGLENQHIDGGAGMFTLQPIALAENTIGRQPENGGNGDGFTVGGPMYTLNATGVHGVAQPIPFDTTQITSPENGSNPQPGDPCHPLTRGGHAPAIVYGLHGQDSRVTELKDVCSTVSATYGMGGGNIPVTVQPIPFKETADCLTSAYGTKWNGNASADHGSLFVQHPVAFNFAPGKGELKDDIHITTANVSKTIDASGSNPAMHQGGTGVVQSVSACDVADTLTVGANQMTGFIGDVVAQPIVLMDQGGSVMNVLEDGTVGTLRRETHGHEPVILQPIALAENTIGRQPENGGNGDEFTVGGPMYTLNATGVHGVAQPIPLDLRNAGRDPEKYDEVNRQGVGVGEPGDPAHTLTTACVHGVAQPTAYAFDALSSNSMKSSNPNSGVNQVDVSKTLDTSRGLDPSCNQGGLGLVQSMAVRRLTPVECERLQGFPDNYTNIPWRNKEESPDGPRYKALGNSMAVPVMHWIGKRIADAS